MKWGLWEYFELVIYIACAAYLSYNFSYAGLAYLTVCFMFWLYLVRSDSE